MQTDQIIIMNKNIILFIPIIICYHLIYLLIKHK